MDIKEIITIAIIISEEILIIIDLIMANREITSNLA